MNRRSFSLKPFPAAGILPEIEIAGTFGRCANMLSLSYAVSGHLKELKLPAAEDVPARKTALWEETCFEFFLGPQNSRHYWEFNLSPIGHWNVYRFTSYREGMQEEAAFESLPFRVEEESGVLRLSLECDLARIVPEGQSLQVAISAVIKTIDNRLTYWALTHPGPQADFHRRDSFILKLQDRPGEEDG